MINVPESTICLTSDGWSDVMSNSVTNHMAVMDVQANFLKSFCSSKQSHTSEWLAQSI